MTDRGPGSHLYEWACRCPVVVFCRLSGYTRAKGLEAGVQNGRVELTGVELSMRSIRNSHFTQHFTVASPQLSNALERGAIVDTDFREASDNSLVAEICSEHRASDFSERFLFDNWGDARVLAEDKSFLSHAVSTIRLGCSASRGQL